MSTQFTTFRATKFELVGFEGWITAETALACNEIIHGVSEILQIEVRCRLQGMALK